MQSSREGNQQGDFRLGEGVNPITVTVVIPTLNSARTLPMVIESLNNQDTPPQEVVVVDGGSSDGTPRIAALGGCTVIEERVGRSRARRLGAAHAKSQFVLFLDSDQLATPGLIAKCARSSAAFDALVIPEQDLISPGFWTGCRRLDRQLAATPETSYPRFLRLETYNRVGGHISGLEDFMEDRNLSIRLRAAGVKVGQVDVPIVNIVGRVSPMLLGLKGFRASRDAAAYYVTMAPYSERPLDLLRARLQAFVTGLHEPRPSIATTLLFPYYLLLVYSPRLARSFAGWVRSILAGGKALSGRPRD